MVVVNQLDEMNGNYGGYEDEAKDDLRCVVEYLRNTN